MLHLVDPTTGEIVKVLPSRPHKPRVYHVRPTAQVNRDIYFSITLVAGLVALIVLTS